MCLTSETVKGLSLTLEGVDNVHGSDGLTAGVLSVGDGITDDVLEKDLEDSAGLFVDQTRNTLDTTTTGETSDSGLGNTLDVVTKDLAMTLGSSLSESLSSLSASRHICCWLFFEIALIANCEMRVVVSWFQSFGFLRV
jgi:hypothetical protein